MADFGINLDIGNMLDWATGTSSAKSYEYSRRLQKHEQEFEKEMSDTAVQRRVQDLQKAKINPILAAGSEATTPDSSGGVVSGPQAPGISMDPVSAYATLKQTKNQTDKTIADIKNQTAETQADVAKKLAEAGYTQKQIDFYIKNGVFPGATITTSGNTSIGWGAAGGGYSNTTPVGLNSNKNNNSAKAFKNMSKEKWNSLSKVQKAMFPKELQELYNNTYND